MNAAASMGAWQRVASVEEALGAGRLLRTGMPEVLDHAELVLRTGPIDQTSRHAVGEGMNGLLHRVQISDPAAPNAPAAWAVEKDAGAQAAQEEFGWKLGRALGIDYLMPTTARRADGIARIEMRAGRGASLEGITDAVKLEEALTRSYSMDTALGLDATEAAHAARVDRQLLQVFDYLLANNDRSMSNALHDAATGAFSFIDHGHAGRGTLPVNGGSVLEPVLQAFQAGRTGGHVAIDREVVDYLRRRIDPDQLRAIHANVFERPDIAGPAGRTIGERFIGHVSQPDYREGVVARFERLLERGGYDHRAYKGDAAGELPPLVDIDRSVRGPQNVRAAFAGLGGMQRF